MIKFVINYKQNYLLVDWKLRLFFDLWSKAKMNNQNSSTKYIRINIPNCFYYTRSNSCVDEEKIKFCSL